MNKKAGKAVVDVITVGAFLMMFVLLFIMCANFMVMYWNKINVQQTLDTSDTHYEVQVPSIFVMDVAGGAKDLMDITSSMGETILLKMPGRVFYQLDYTRNFILAYDYVNGKFEIGCRVDTGEASLNDYRFYPITIKDADKKARMTDQLNYVCVDLSSSSGYVTSGDK